MLKKTCLYMVKCHEDAYWLETLSLFAFNIEGYWAHINKHKICAKVRKIIQSQGFLSKFQNIKQYL